MNSMFKTSWILMGSGDMDISRQVYMIATSSFPVQNKAQKYSKI